MKQPASRRSHKRPIEAVAEAANEDKGNETMKQEIHPTYYPEARVICSCGATWTTGSTVAEIRTDVCSSCHPFYTGEQRIVDTAGQVERFMKRLERRQSDSARRELTERMRKETEEAARRARARGDDPEKAAAEVLAKYENAG